MAVPRSGAQVTVSDESPGHQLDLVLVNEVISGSQDALASLYDRHANPIYVTALRTSDDPWVAAEVVQETFLALWNRAEQFDPTRASLRTWLQTIARNRAIDRRRAARRHDRAVTFASFGHDDDGAFNEWLATAGDFVGSAAPEPSPEAVTFTREMRDAVGGAVATLPPDERAAITLAYGRGMSQSEIATALALPLGTVKTRTRRALQHLRDAFGGLNGDTWSDSRPTSSPRPADAGRLGYRMARVGSEPAPCLSAKC